MTKDSDSISQTKMSKNLHVNYICARVLEFTFHNQVIILEIVNLLIKKGLMFVHIRDPKIGVYNKRQISLP